VEFTEEEEVVGGVRDNNEAAAVSSLLLPQNPEGGGGDIVEIIRPVATVEGDEDGEKNTVDINALLVSSEPAGWVEAEITETPFYYGSNSRRMHAMRAVHRSRKYQRGSREDAV
jgi:hypothetical protein